MTGCSDASASRGNGENWKSDPAGGLPDEPEATVFVNNWASFLAPVSTNLACKPEYKRKMDRKREERLF